MYGITRTKEWNVHKAIIANTSEYFQKAFNGEFKEGKASEQIYHEDPDIMKLVLQYMYEQDYTVPTNSKPYPGRFVRRPNATTGIRITSWSHCFLWRRDRRLLYRGLQQIDTQAMTHVVGLIRASGCQYKVIIDVGIAYLSIQLTYNLGRHRSQRASHRRCGASLPNSPATTRHRS